MTNTGLAPSGSAQGADLFGPDPGKDPLAHYLPPDPAADMFTAAPPEIAARWRAFAAGVAAQSHGNLAAMQSQVDRQVQDLGLAFRLTGDDQERAWPLNPMPIMIGADEWANLEAGLVQRAELLETVIADIYGPQHLISEGHLPAAAVSGSAHFARRMTGLRPPGGHFMHVCAFDLARGPTGEWRVLADRARLALGIGYALENRLAIGRATGSLLASVGARRQTGFFQALRRGIAANCARAEPRIGLLTPGRFNQSYPEQAHLARHLGFSLVEGRDLIVRDEKLFVRTIAGLKRIDALWRWIGTRDIDPLHFDARSQIGVPNLIKAATHGLVMANWPGVGVVESRAMPAFLPRIAKVLLGEALRLPNAATWWCGGETERKHVLANLDRLVISSAFRQPVAGLPDGHTLSGASLSAQQRAELEQGMARRPMDYTAQEIVSLSTTPALAGGKLEPRGFTMRAFLARDANGNWTALPGGFGRISERGDLRTSLMGLGDISTDVCIIDPVPHGNSSKPDDTISEVRREQGLLPSQAADNLFWIGRYGERGHQNVRIIRSLIEQAALTGERVEAASAVTRLSNLLRQLGAVPAESRKWQPSRLVESALVDGEQVGSVRGLARTCRQIALLLRDRITRDSWRVIHRPMPRFNSGDLESIRGACDRLLERYAALAGMVAEGMSRTPAWRFLDMGICIERGSMALLAARHLATADASPEDLSALLDLADGQALYRSRYLTIPLRAPVLDMVLLDPAQPQGLAFQLQAIEAHLAALPPLRDDGMIEPQLMLVRQLRTRLECLQAHDLASATIDALLGDVAKLSDAIGKRFFLQEDGPKARSEASLLA